MPTLPPARTPRKKKSKRASGLPSLALPPVRAYRSGMSELVPSTTRTPRWWLVRDVVVLQGKLFIGGSTLAVLGPLAFVAALVGLVVPGGHPGRYFYAVLRAGRRFEHWVHLYRDADGDTKRAGPGGGLDAIVDEVETVITDRTRRDRDAVAP